MDEWERHFPFVHVRTSRLAHSFIASQIEQVVDQLEGDTQFHAEARQPLGLFLCQTCDQASSVASCCKRSGCFAFHDTDVIFGSGGKIENVVQLMKLGNCDVGTASGDDFDDL